MKIYDSLKTLPARSISKVLRTIQSNDDFIVTGIPRSGTSLMCSFLTNSKNCVCFNEIHYDIETLPYFFWKMRRKIKKSQPVPNKMDENYNIITSQTDDNKDTVRKSVFPKNGQKIILGSKVTVPYLNQINKILKRDYKKIVMIRDPVYALGSWNRDDLSDTPMGKVMPDNLHPHWEEVDFTKENIHERRAEIWEHYAKLIKNIEDEVKIIKYEDLTEETKKIEKQLKNYLGVDLRDVKRNYQNQNLESKYNNIPEIRKAVKKYCPTRKNFDY